MPCLLPKDTKCKKRETTGLPYGYIVISILKSVGANCVRPQDIHKTPVLKNHNASEYSVFSLVKSFDLVEKGYSK